MEFRPQDIAQLVLGYLKDEKCYSAFSEFLSSSVYLKDHAASHNKGKYFITRVAGLSLVDYLMEYADIYTIAQERLEASKYFEENRSKRTTLIKQLLYLLDNEGIQTRTSTPLQEYGTSRRHHERDLIQPPSCVNKEVQHVPESNINNSFARLCAGLNTTPSHSLPGNSSFECSSHNSSKRKNIESVPKVDKSTSTEEDFETREKSQENLEIFTQTLSENSEFIEKLTENINKEVSAKSDTSELDDSIIQSIVQQTESEPVFVQLFEEFIGTVNGEDEEELCNSSPEKCAGDRQEQLLLDLPKAPVLPSTPKKPQEAISTPNIFKQRLRSFKKSNVSPSRSPPSIEEANNEAIESIIAASLSGEKQPVDSENSSSAPSMSMEIVVPTASYDNIMQTTQNQMFSNTNGLLMLQPSGTVPCTNVMGTRNLQVEPPKPCYIIGNQPFVNVPQTPFKVLTEQDILTMPTIFVCDNNQQSVSTQTVIVSQPAPATNSLTQNRLLNIAPKETPKKAQTLSEYITLYQCNDSYSTVIQQPSVQHSPPKPRAKLKQIASTTSKGKKIANKTRHTPLAEKPEVAAQPMAPTIQPNISSNLVAESVQVIENAIPAIDKEFLNQPPEENKHITPKTTKGAEKKDILSRSTPRSGSHVRQLDFSTPEKWLPTLRRSATSPKVDKLLDPKDSLFKSIKTNAAKSIRTTLFKSPDAEVPAVVTSGVTEKQNTVGELGPNLGKIDDITEMGSGESSKPIKEQPGATSTSWDADLRALAASSVVPPKAVPQKPKRKRIEESPKPNGSSKKFKEGAASLNKTEDDALKIEMALQGIGVEPESRNNIIENLNESVKDKSANKRRDRLTTKKVISTKKLGKSSGDKLEPVMALEAVPNPAADKLGPISVDVDEAMPEHAENSKKMGNEQNFVETPYAVINRNMKPRIKKKCNMENAIKKPSVPEEIVLTNVTKIRSCEIIDDGQNTLILSPSKLNANKRSLVEIDNRSVVEQHVVIKSTSGAVNTDRENEDTTDIKVTTPEHLKSSTNNPPLAAQRNIMPLLETPVKFDSIAFPKTPGIATSPVIDTPFTKAVIDQLTGVDITTIPTPMFPITPNFAFTPVYDQSPHFSNRGTDYSTSSSYYQPSDNDQNKSMEQLIEESNRVGRQPASIENTKDAAEDNQSAVESNKALERLEGAPSTASPTKNVPKPVSIETVKIPESTNLHSQPGSSQLIKTTISDKQKAFNLGVIGKKNLHLVKMMSENAEVEKESSSDSSSSDCDSSSSSSDESDSSNCSFADVDLTERKDKTASPYSLRPRKSLAGNAPMGSNGNREKQIPVEQPKPVAAASKPSNVPEIPLEESPPKPLSSKDGVLKQLEEIRQRTIAKFKDTSSNAKKLDSSKKKKPVAKPKRIEKEIIKPAQKLNPTKANRPKKISEINNQTTTNKVPDDPIKKQRRKSDSPKKSELVKNLIQQELLAQQKESFAAAKLNRNQSSPGNTKAESSKKPKPQPRPSGATGPARKNSRSELALPKNKAPSEAPNLHQSETVTDSSKAEFFTDEEHPGPSKLAPKHNETAPKLISPRKLKPPGGLPQKATKPQITYITLKEAKAMVDDEDDIILHLSSDEENLAPFEIVETELLECSTSSTPFGDEDRMNQMLDVDTSLKQKPSEPKIDETVDQEAESLVKGLKQWGIHLIPNKPAKKSSSFIESMEGVFSGTKVVDQQRSESPHEEMPKATPENRPKETKKLKISRSVEGLNAKNQGKEKKKPNQLNKTFQEKEKSNQLTDTLKAKNQERGKPAEVFKGKNQEKDKRKLNRSIEEGELVSDAEVSPKKEGKLEKPKLSKDRKPSLGRTTHARRSSDSSRENKRSQDRHRTSKEPHKFRSEFDGLSKHTSKSKVLDKHLPNKSSRPAVKAPDKIVKNKAAAEENQTQNKAKPVVEKEVAPNELEFQTEFDLRTYEQETFSVSHDYSKKAPRKITDYNFEILAKKFSANVYIAEIDSEVEKMLLFTPFEFLLDIPGKLPAPVNQKRSSIANKPSTSETHFNKRKQNPLKILYNQLVKPGDDSPHQASPLDDLYAPESTRQAEEPQKKAAERNVSMEKPDKNDNSGRYKQKSTAKEQSRSVESLADHQKAKHHLARESPTDTVSTKVEVLSTVSLNCKEENAKQSASDLEVVEGVIMLNSNVEDVQQKESEDELMNYALIGSERVEDCEEPFTTDKKRKTAEGTDGDKTQEKKQKTEVSHELLRNIDVDSFLKKLHGET